MKQIFLLVLTLLMIVGGGQAVQVDTQGWLQAPGEMVSMSGNTATYGSTLDAVGEYAGIVIAVPQTGTLKKVCIGFGTVTAQNTFGVNVSIETVDTSTGYPTGTLYQSGATGIQMTQATATAYWIPINGATGISVTKGDNIAIKVASDAGNLIVNTAAYVSTGQSSFPYEFSYVNSASAKQYLAPNFGLEYSTGMVPVLGGFPGLTSISTSNWEINTASTPDHASLRFKLPYDAYINATTLLGSFQYDVDVVLYDSDGVTELERRSCDKDVQGYTSISPHTIQFLEEHKLNKNTYYRVAFVPTGSYSKLYYATGPADGDIKFLDGMSGGQNFHASTCTDAPDAEGDWTNDLTVRPWISIWLSKVDDGTGTGTGGIIGGRGGGRGSG
jgi:hypothetical protein